MNAVVTLGIGEAQTLAESALRAAGAGVTMATSLARATVDAERRGKPAVGFSHLVDYLDSLIAGRINGKAAPKRNDPAPALITMDADGGIAQLCFDLAIADLCRKTETYGLCLFSVSNSYTTGELGDYVVRLAERGLVAFAATNGPALITGSGGTKPVYCTNPLAFAAPRAEGPPLLIDQSSSATAFVNVRNAAAEDAAIPAGWAVDAAGQPTTDAKAALKGAMLAFGGARGANIALMIEVLAAGLSGANWSLDAPDFMTGSKTPGCGLLVIAIAPTLLDPQFEERLGAQLDRLEKQYGVHIPGKPKVEASACPETQGIHLPSALLRRISAFTGL